MAVDCLCVEVRRSDMNRPMADAYGARKRPGTVFDLRHTLSAISCIFTDERRTRDEWRHLSFPAVVAQTIRPWRVYRSWRRRRPASRARCGVVAGERSRDVGAQGHGRPRDRCESESPKPMAAVQAAQVPICPGARAVARQINGTIPSPVHRSRACRITSRPWPNVIETWRSSPV